MRLNTLDKICQLLRLKLSKLNPGVHLTSHNEGVVG